MSMGSIPRDFKKAFSSSLSSKPPWSQAKPICMFLSFKFFKDERGIGSAKPEGVGHGDVQRLSSCYIRDIIEVTLWIGFLIVDRGGHDPISNGQEGEKGLWAPGCP